MPESLRIVVLGIWTGQWEVEDMGLDELSIAGWGLQTCCTVGTRNEGPKEHSVSGKGQSGLKCKNRRSWLWCNKKLKFQGSVGPGCAGLWIWHVGFLRRQWESTDGSACGWSHQVMMLKREELSQSCCPQAIAMIQAGGHEDHAQVSRGELWEY